MLKDILNTLLLTNDITVLPNGDNWKFIMRALSKQKVKDGKHIFYSQKAPKVKFDGRELKIGYTPNAVEQIHLRTKNKKYDYGTLGDVFSFFYENNYFEYVELGDENSSFSIFGMCGDEGSMQFKIVEAIYGKEYFSGDKYYYRLGYLPFEI